MQRSSRKLYTPTNQFKGIFSFSLVVFFRVSSNTKRNDSLGLNDRALADYDEELSMILDAIRNHSNITHLDVSGNEKDFVTKVMKSSSLFFSVSIANFAEIPFFQSRTKF